jgi:hypothetical protein
MRFFSVFKSRFSYLGILCLILALTMIVLSRTESGTAQTTCGSGTCPAGTSCCDGRACCKDGTPHYCIATNSCYQTAAQANAACGNAYKVCYK